MLEIGERVLLIADFQTRFFEYVNALPDESVKCFRHPHATIVHMQKISIVGVPMDLGADRRGVDMGPSALRYADLNEKLHNLGYEVEDLGDLDVIFPEVRQFGDPRVKYL